MGPSFVTVERAVDFPDKADMERVNYFPRQLITANDMIQEQEYFREKLRAHNRLMHGWGVVSGLVVTYSNGKIVTIDRGFALSQQGDEIYVREPQTLDLSQSFQETSSDCDGIIRNPSPINSEETRYIAIRYHECMIRPVRVMPAHCGCEEAVCEYSRIRESFEIACCKEKPAKDDSPWVILASVALKDGSIKVDYVDKSKWTPNPNLEK
ncbi:MAG: hypothetical protein WC600_08640 [Desulfobaccales bacterium]